jgi:DNA-binding MarR family transcriptional regulator
MTDDPIAFRVFNEIGIIEQLARNRFERVMPYDLTISQFVLLNHFVRVGGEKSPAQLATIMQVTKATMTSTLQRLESKKFVQVVPDPKDGRAKRVTITDAGRAARQAALLALQPEIIAVTKAHGETALKALVEPLTALRVLLDRMRDPV